MTSPIRLPSSALAWLLLLAALLAACGGNDDEGGGQPFTRPEDTQPGTAAVIQAGPLSSYYVEASIKAANRSANSSYVVIKGWFDASGSTRWDITSSNAADAQYVRQILVSGDDKWFYEPGTNTYTQEKEPGLAAQLKGAPYPLLSLYQLGVVPPSATAGALKTGAETYLGRDVDIFVTTSETMQRTVWVDREYGFTLRQVVKSSDPAIASFEVAVEKVQFNPRLDPQTFVFVPPPGARNASATPATGGIKATHGPLNVPPGLLSPTYIPAGYTLASSTQTTSGGVTSYIERTLSNAAGESLTLTETYRPGGLPENLKTGTVFKLRGTEAYSTRGGGRTSLVFYDADIIVIMLSPTLSVTEMRRVAESMVVAP